jgi:hypothetical protein
MNRLIRKAIHEWQNWLSRRRMYRAYPELQEIARKRQECRSKHRKGAASLDRQARDLMCAALKGGRA